MENRKRDGPEKFLSGFEGYLQSDACGGVTTESSRMHLRWKRFEARTTAPRRSLNLLMFVKQIYEVGLESKDASEAKKLVL
jgi:transposase